MYFNETSHTNDATIQEQICSSVPIDWLPQPSHSSVGLFPFSSSSCIVWYSGLGWIWNIKSATTVSPVYYMIMCTFCFHFVELLQMGHTQFLFFLKQWQWRFACHRYIHHRKWIKNVALGKWWTMQLRPPRLLACQKYSTGTAIWGVCIPTLGTHFLNHCVQKRTETPTPIPRKS